MYDVLGALAFAVLVVSYVLAVLFVRHPDNSGYSRHRSAHHGGNSRQPASP